MNISDAAERSGVPPKTIRYYEEIGLLRPARGPNGYRDFAERDVHVLAFLGRARALGFPIEDCRALLQLWEDGTRPSAEVKAIAAHHLAEMDRKLGELREMRSTLSDLVEACHGDERPDCPILDSLGEGGAR